jgi:hypothetical protein
MIDYAAIFTNFTGAFPNITADNVSAPGAGDGTEFVKAMVDDIWGRAQALMSYAGLSPDGVQEAPGTAQVLSALKKGFVIGPGIIVNYPKNDTPAAKGDRLLLLQGQVILIATYPLLAAEVYCGDANNPTAPAYYKTSDAGGTTRNITGAYLVLPDHRGLSPKMIGNATVNTRTKTGPVSLGEKQEDQTQGTTHTHYVPGSNAGGATGYGKNATVDANGVYSNGVTYDNASGTPRIGNNTRDSCLGTNFGITY